MPACISRHRRILSPRIVKGQMYGTRDCTGLALRKFLAFCTQRQTI